MCSLVYFARQLYRSTDHARCIVYKYCLSKPKRYGRIRILACELVALLGLVQDGDEKISPRVGIAKL
jgi:hypothetical protein